jgi:hypothetical protein
MASNQHNPGAVAIPIPSRHIGSSSGIMTPCGCRCGGCSCLCCSRGHVLVLDPNRITYGGQGTSAGTFLSDAADLNGSSLEAQQPQTTVNVPPSLELLSKLDDRTQAELAEARTEKYLDDILDAPLCHDVLGSGMPGDAPEMSGMFFGPIDLDGSMENNPASTANRSMRSSYMSGMTLQGEEAAGGIVQHDGAAPTAARITPVSQHHQYAELL